MAGPPGRMLLSLKEKHREDRGERGSDTRLPDYKGSPAGFHERRKLARFPIIGVVMKKECFSWKTDLLPS